MISICIPAFNGAPYILEQLSSILCQIGDNDEIIVSDDHSMDNTVAKIKELNESRIKIITNEGRAGTVSNMENALKHARGERIFMSDQDDIWFPDKVAVMIASLETHDLVVSDAEVVDHEGKLLHPSFYKINHSGKGFLRNWVNNSFMGCCMAFNRKILEYVLPFPPNLAMHDSWIGLNAALVGKCCFLPQPLIWYRRHGKNVIITFSKTALPVTYQVQYRLVMMYHIIRRRLQRKVNG